MESAEAEDQGEYTLPENSYTAPEGMTFLKWDITGVTPTTHGALTVTAVYEEDLFVYYGFEGQYPHYAELAWTAPNGDAQTKSASAAANWYMQEVYALDLTHGKTPTIAEGFKNAKNLTTVEYEGTNAYLSVQLGSEKPSGYITFGANEDYNVGIMFFLNGAVLSEDVKISIDFRMTAEGAFPLNFYLRSQNNKFHSNQDRICLLNMDGQGNLTVGYDNVNSARVAYVDASGATLTQSEILATASIGDWHTFTFELRESDYGYDVAIFLDGEQIGEESYNLKISGTSFTGEKPFNMLMVFVGAGKAVQAVDAYVAATGAAFECNYDFDNFVVAELN